MHAVTAILLPVVILGLPVYFISRYLEIKMQPRKNHHLFLWWLIAVMVFSFAWYFICMFIFFKFFSLVP